MKLGYFMMPLHAIGRPWGESYDMDIEAALYADEAGYDELWVGEHYSAQTEPISDSLQFLSYLLPLTKNVKLCTGVLNLPHHHPAKVAANCAMFDHMSKGRFIMGIGPGGLSTDFELFGTLDKNRGEMMVESAGMIRKIWEGDAPYDIQGKYWNVRIVDTYQGDMGLGPIPKPLRNPFPPFVTSAMSPYSGTAKLAGQMGWDLTSANFNAAWVVRSHWQKYVEGAEAAGRKASPDSWRVARSIVLADSDAEAQEYMERPMSAAFAYYHYLYTQLGRAGAKAIFQLRPDQKPEDVELQDVVDDMVIVGSRKTVLDRLIAFADEVGPFGGLLLASHEWDDKAFWRNCMRGVKEDVMPKFAQHVASMKVAA